LGAVPGMAGGLWLCWSRCGREGPGKATRGARGPGGSCRGGGRTFFGWERGWRGPPVTARERAALRRGEWTGRRRGAGIPLIDCGLHLSSLAMG